MITEDSIIDDETGEIFKRIIKGDGFSIELEFNTDKSIQKIGVCEKGKNRWFPLSSANYDNKGNLVSKYLFSYDENEEITGFTELNNENTIVSKTVYYNNGMSSQYSCFDGMGNLIYTYKGQRDVNDGVYKDANGNEISDDKVRFLENLLTL